MPFFGGGGGSGGPAIYKYVNTTNIAGGTGALGVVTGNDNMGLGTGALENLLSGDSNVCIGYDTALTLLTGGGNVIMGALAGNSMATAVNNGVFIGQSACFHNGGSGTVLIGASSVTDTTTNNVGVGNAVTAQGGGAVAVGNSASAGGINAIAVGNGTTATGDGIAIGAGVSAAANHIVIGDNTYTTVSIGGVAVSGPLVYNGVFSGLPAASSVAAGSLAYVTDMKSVFYSTHSAWLSANSSFYFVGAFASFPSGVGVPNLATAYATDQNWPYFFDGSEWCALLNYVANTAFASFPAANLFQAGTLAYATDTNTPYFSNGTAWTALGDGSSVPTTGFLTGFAIAWSSTTAITVASGNCLINGALESFTGATLTSGSTMRGLNNAVVTLGASKAYYVYAWNNGGTLQFAVQDWSDATYGGTAVYDLTNDYYKAAYAPVGVNARRIGKFVTDGSGNIISFVQTSEGRTRNFSFMATTFLSGGTSASYTQIVLTPFILPDDTKTSGYANNFGTSGTVSVSVDGVNNTFAFSGSSGGLYDNFLLSTNVLYYRATGSAYANLYINGFSHYI
jgi:hypothetical protein